MLRLAELARAVRLLDRRLSGHRIQETAQPDTGRVAIGTYGAGADGESERLHVLLCADPETARLSLLDALPPRPASPPAFDQWLRAHASGARIAGVRLLGGDRVAAIELDAKPGRLRLVLQLLGRRSNLYALEAEDRLVAALRPLAATRPELALGEAWRLPESRPPTAGVDRFEDAADAGFFARIEQAYGEREAASEHEGVRRSIERALRAEERSLDRKLAKVEDELRQAQVATELARTGELLKTALPQLRKGDSEAKLCDPETGAEIVVPLDPARSPAENLEQIFKRAKKGVRQLTKGGAREASLRSSRAEAAALRARFEAAADEEDALRALAEGEAAALLRRHAPAVQPKPSARAREEEVKIGGRKVPRRLLPRRYPTAAGLEIWVGRSDAANDFLSTRLARGKDLFFHLDGAPGSHVILRTGGRDDPPSEALLDACELAVHYSRAKNATRADVHIVPISNVRKPRGAKPGLVTVHGGKTLHLRRTPARLQRLLESRLDW